MIQTQPVIINDKNTEELTKKLLTLQFNGVPFTPSSLYVEKFSLVKRVPVFIPEIIYGDDQIFNQSTNNIDLTNTYFTTLNKTNLAVAVENTATGKFAWCNVRWQGQNGTQPPLNIQLDRLSVLNNEYFYAYTTVQLINMIKTYLGYCKVVLGLNGKMNFVKTSSGQYQLMLENTDVDKIKIYFNNQLKLLFPFDYTQYNSYYSQVNFDVINTTNINDINYVVSETINKSVWIFPFKSIVFTSPNINVQRIVQTNDINVVQILNYSLNIDDPDSGGSIMAYTLGTLNWVLSVGSQINGFYLNADFITWDGFTVPIYLGYKEYCEMTVIFNP